MGQKGQVTCPTLKKEAEMLPFLMWVIETFS